MALIDCKNRKAEIKNIFKINGQPDISSELWDDKINFYDDKVKEMRRIIEIRSSIMGA